MPTDANGNAPIPPDGAIPTLGYLVATRPFLEKAAGGVVHPTPEAAFEAVGAMGAEGASFNVYEARIFVSKDPMPPAMKMG